MTDGRYDPDGAAASPYPWSPGAPRSPYGPEPGPPAGPPGGGGAPGVAAGAPAPGSRRERRLREIREAEEAARTAGAPATGPPGAGAPGAGAPAAGAPAAAAPATRALRAPAPDTRTVDVAPRRAARSAPPRQPAAPPVSPVSLPTVAPAPHRPAGHGARDPQGGRGRRGLRAAVAPLAAVLLLGWAMTALVGDVRWGPASVLPVLLAATSPLALLGALPVAVHALQRRRWAVLVPAVAAAGLPWVFTLPYVLPADAPPTRATPAPLRALLVSSSEGQVDAASLAVAARTQRADLVVVQELTPRLAHDLAVAGLGTTLVPRYVVVPPAGGPATAGIGVYSRFAVDTVQPLRSMSSPSVRLRVLVGDRPVTVVVGHAARPSIGHLDAWRHDLRVLRLAAGVPGPVLVLGTLDATPWNPQFRQLTAGRLHDAADVLGHGLRPTWPSWSPLPLLPADHAIVAGLGVVSIDTVALAGTDHRALSVELAVPQK